MPCPGPTRGRNCHHPPLLLDEPIDSEQQFRCQRAPFLVNDGSEIGYCLCRSERMRERGTVCQSCERGSPPQHLNFVKSLASGLPGPHKPKFLLKKPFF